MGIGSTVKYVVERLGQLKEEFGPMVCVPTSFQSKLLLVEQNLTVSDVDSCPELDVAIDGADEVDEHCHCIKGGGGCQLQEKIVASCAKVFVIVADFRKQSKVLGSSWKTGVPLEVIPAAYKLVEKQIKAIGGTPTLRMAAKKAGPVITDNGNFVLDCDFGEIADPVELNRKLKQMVGVVETGLFCNMASRAFFGQKDGSVIDICK